VPASRVIVAGRSLGSAVALELASRVPTAGVALFSPIDSVPTTGARLYSVIRPIAHLATARFDTREKLPRIGVPILIVHAVADEWVPISIARSLVPLIKGDKWLLETGGGHNDAGFESAPTLRDAFRRWWPSSGL
jgi:pimeloyl-ACP methyl ester carboxylesterase